MVFLQLLIGQMAYPFHSIEKKWQSYWADNQTFAAESQSEKPKFYVLDMFPYPSGAGLHVGHPLGYIASDIVARYKRNNGFNVLHPQGYDSFGLPAEQYAIQTGQHPAVTTAANIKRYREQLDQLGFSFDWSREVRTSDPDYYRWTQWMFLQLFSSWFDTSLNKARPIEELIAHLDQHGTENLHAHSDSSTAEITAQQWNAHSDKEKETYLLNYRLAYLANTEVNWCPELGTVLANDEVVNGVSERGGYAVVRKKMTQWSMRISAYAERLLEGLHTIDWPEPLKEMQRNWIGRSVGASVYFTVDGYEELIEVFTTRPDTLYGVSFMTLAPEHPLVAKITTQSQKHDVENYVQATATRSERERMSDVKNISGVFTGAYAIHPFTEEKIPIWIGDYVLAGYGTGAVMAVPCGDQRDYDFAKHFDLPIKNIFADKDISEAAHVDKNNTQIAHSDFLNGLDVGQATKEVIRQLSATKKGTAQINYRLRDAVFSRQRYWGEPIPIFFDKGIPKGLPKEALPLRLPEVEKYLPTPEGAPPLGNASHWAWDTLKKEVVSNAEIDHKQIFPLELNTMPGWAGSSWYFNRYMDAHNESTFADKSALDYWGAVDLYVGGSEHATGHLLYARFWQKVLFDLGHVSVEEFAKKLINQGMILGNSAFIYRISGTQTFLSKGLVNDKKVEPIHIDISLVDSNDAVDLNALKQWQPHFKDAIFETEEGAFFAKREVEKMSKSKYNVVNPDDICKTYGADTMRMYEIFLGPIEQAKPWNTAGITGVFGFVNKFWRLFHDQNTFLISEDQASKEALKVLHGTIEKVTQDIEQLSLNTAVSAFMICVNELTRLGCNQREVLEPLTVLLSPFAPHVCEEIWSLLGHKSSVVHAPFPKAVQEYLKESTKTYPISFNGKVRFTIDIDVSADSKTIEEIVLADDRTHDQLGGKTIRKVIVVPNKIVNVVC
jgi:leucyl-tRNA synthetase